MKAERGPLGPIPFGQDQDYPNLTSRECFATSAYQLAMLSETRRQRVAMERIATALEWWAVQNVRGGDDGKR